MKTILSVYIAGRRRIFEEVDEPALMRGLHAIRKQMPELELGGRVIVTAEDDGVTHIIPLPEELA